MRRTLLFCLLCLLLALPLAAQDATPDAPPVNGDPGETDVMTAPETGNIPDAMPVVDEGGYDIVNILLLGATTNDDDRNPGLTDSIMIVSVNRDTKTVSAVSIPRDFWVYAPGIGMSKINQVYFFGERKQKGSGIDALKQTILYNLGLQIDYYAKVNFSTFGELINSVGGIDVTVDCAIQDWMLKSIDLDRSDPNSWEMYTLPAGQHSMGGALALWYVRSRRTSSDLDRGRRQQDVLRAVYRKMRTEGLLQNFPALWEQLNKLVVTDITLPDALNLLPVALNTDTADVRYFIFRLQVEVNNGYSEDEGRFILIPIRDVVAKLMQNVVLPPTSSQIRRTLPTVAIVNASGVKGMAAVAADRLELEGFRTIVLDEQAGRQSATTVTDYTGLDKSNPVDTIEDILRIAAGGVTTEPDPNRQYDYKVYVGNEYVNRSCTRPVLPPKEIPAEPTAEPTATGG